MELDTGADAGVFHVVNLQPFHTWDSVSSSRCMVPVTERLPATWAPHDGEPVAQIDCQTDLPAGDMCGDLDDHTDSGSVPAMAGDPDDHSTLSVSDPGTDFTDCGPVPFMDCDPEVCSATGVSDPCPVDADHYSLRQRRHPRITSGWSTSRWTNSYHTDRLNLQ